MVTELVQEQDGEAFSCVCQQYTLCTLDETGALVRDFVISMPKEEGWSWNVTSSLAYQPGGFLWMDLTQTDPATGEVLQSCLQRMGLDGSVARVMMPGCYACDLQVLPDGYLWLFGQDLSGMTQAYSLYVVEDAATSVPVLFRGATLRKDTALPFAFAKPLFEEQTTEASTAAVICGFHDMRQFDLTTGQARTLLKWENYQVDFSAVSAVFLLEEEDQYLVIDRDNSFHLLTVVDDMLLDDDIITFAVTGNGYTKQLQAAVDAYNATQPEKFVTILDYTIEAATERGFSGSEEMLQRAILDDEAPDIVMTPSGMNSQNLIRQGFFADLYPLLDADPELQRADFLENVLACCEYQDTLPTIIPAFSIFTAVGSSDLVGETPGWNWQEYDALCAAYPDATPFYGLGRNDILLYLLQMGGDRFIDYEKGGSPSGRRGLCDPAGGQRRLPGQLRRAARRVLPGAVCARGRFSDGGVAVQLLQPARVRIPL